MGRLGVAPLVIEVVLSFAFNRRCLVSSNHGQL